MKNGRIVQHIVIDDHADARVLFGDLPAGVNHIKTVLLYKEN